VPANHAHTPEPVEVRLIREPEGEKVPESGSVISAQEAEFELPVDVLDSLWTPEYLERLARSYWRFLSRITLSLIRVVYGDDFRSVVLLSPRLPLLRFRAPEYETGDDAAGVTWRIERGLLVAREGRDHGHLRIEVRRCGAGVSPSHARLRVRVEVRNFYPWLRGRFARFGTWIYANTQLRIHVLVCHLFLRSLARLDFPPSRVGALRAEIDQQTDTGAGA
jgi:hypothetical protein